MPGFFHSPARPQSAIREEKWVDRPQMICQSRDKVKAELWLPTAGQRGSLGPGSAVLGPEKKGRVDPSPHSESRQGRGKGQPGLGDKMTSQ